MTLQGHSATYRLKRPGFSLWTATARIRSKSSLNGFASGTGISLCLQSAGRWPGGSDFEKCVRAFVTNCFDPTEIKAGFHHKTESKATTIWNGSNSKTTSRETAGYECSYPNYELALSGIWAHRQRAPRHEGVHERGVNAPKLLKDLVCAIVKDNPRILRKVKTAGTY